MIALRTGLTASAVAVAVLLAALALSPGIGRAGVLTGLACATALGTAVARGAAGWGGESFGPADLVTLARAALGCGVAALVADAAVEGTTAASAGVWTLTSLAAIALALDAVDGWVARATSTVTGFGARLDLEADAFLILVLSIHVARSSGAWVLAFGAARYLFGVAGWLWPWMRSQLPSRYWRKVVAATVGVALAVAVVESTPATTTLLACALALLAESFGRDVVWLWRHRIDPSADTACSRQPREIHGRIVRHPTTR